MSTDRARPSAALVMFPGLDDRVIGPAARARLEVAVDLVTPTAFATPDDLTGELAGHVEVLITGWSCPRPGGADPNQTGGRGDPWRTPPLSTIILEADRSARLRAGEENRTPVISLGSWGSTIELHPR